TLAFDVAHDLRHRVLRRYRDHHVHMVAHQMPFLDPALLLLGQPPQDLPHVLPQLPIQNLPPILRYEDHVVFGLQPGMASTLVVVPRVCSWRVVGGSRSGFPRWAPAKVKLLLPPRQRRGASPGRLESSLPRPLLLEQGAGLGQLLVHTSEAVEKAGWFQL